MRASCDRRGRTRAFPTKSACLTWHLPRRDGGRQVAKLMDFGSLTGGLTRDRAEAVALRPGRAQPSSYYLAASRDRDRLSSKTVPKRLRAGSRPVASWRSRARSSSTVTPMATTDSRDPRRESDVRAAARRARLRVRKKRVHSAQWRAHATRDRARGGGQTSAAQRTGRALFAARHVCDESFA